MKINEKLLDKSVWYGGILSQDTERFKDDSPWNTVDKIPQKQYLTGENSLTKKMIDRTLKIKSQRFNSGKYVYVWECNATTTPHLIEYPDTTIFIEQSKRGSTYRIHIDGLQIDDWNINLNIGKAGAKRLSSFLNKLALCLIEEYKDEIAESEKNKT